MKRFYAILPMLGALLIGSLTAAAQLDVGFHFKVKNRYRFGGPTPLMYSRGGVLFEKKVQPKVGWQKIFTNNLKADLIHDSNKNIKVIFWGIKRESVNVHGDNSFVNMQDSTANFYYVLSETPTLSSSVRYFSIPYAEWEVGAATIPFKYFFRRYNKYAAPSGAVTDFNAGVYGGRRWGRRRFYRDSSKDKDGLTLTTAVFVGPTTVDLSKDNIKVADTTFKSSTQLAASAGGGLLFSYQQFSVGIFGGLDVPIGAEGQKWIYANHLWLGFGFGYALKIFGEK